jgi:hypothetical protein
MPKIEIPNFKVEELSPQDRAELSRQLAEAQAVGSSAETGISEEVVKANPVEMPVIKGAAIAPDEKIPADVSATKNNFPGVELPADRNQPAQNLSNLLNLVQEGQFITKSGEPLTDLNAFMNNLNQRLANPKPEDLDPKNRIN